MSKVLDILQTRTKLIDSLVYNESAIDDRFNTVEVSSREGVLFREWYYIVDVQNSKVYVGDFKVPSAVLVERIKNGVEKAL